MDRWTSPKAKNEGRRTGLPLYLAVMLFKYCRWVPFELFLGDLLLLRRLLRCSKDEVAWLSSVSDSDINDGTALVASGTLVSVCTFYTKSKIKNIRKKTLRNQNQFHTRIWHCGSLLIQFTLVSFLHQSTIFNMFDFVDQLAMNRLTKSFN